jgi:hypothetical protein
MRGRRATTLFRMLCGSARRAAGVANLKPTGWGDLTVVLGGLVGRTSDELSLDVSG